jgi:hypothetical protein
MRKGFIKPASSTSAAVGGSAGSGSGCDASKEVPEYYYIYNIIYI